MLVAEREWRGEHWTARKFVEMWLMVMQLEETWQGYRTVDCECKELAVLLKQQCQNQMYIAFCAVVFTLYSLATRVTSWFAVNFRQTAESLLSMVLPACWWFRCCIIVVKFLEVVLLSIYNNRLGLFFNVFTCFNDGLSCISWICHGATPSLFDTEVALSS